MKKLIAIIIIGLLMIFGIGFYGFPKVRGLTDVRVGPTAAIGISCSADGEIVYIAHGNGVYKSNDGGKNWKQIY